MIFDSSFLKTNKDKILSLLEENYDIHIQRVDPTSITINKGFINKDKKIRLNVTYKVLISGGCSGLTTEEKRTESITL